jgi:ABC-type Mn2+/Zn2+ transport system permease subunit
VNFWNLLLYFTLGLVIAFSMQFAGVMLVFNFLVLPAVTGLLLSRSMAGVFFWSIVSAVVAAVIGFMASVPFDLPSGPAIIAVSGVLALLAFGVRVIQRR